MRWLYDYCVCFYGAFVFRHWETLNLWKIWNICLLIRFGKSYVSTFFQALSHKKVSYVSHTICIQSIFFFDGLVKNVNFTEYSETVNIWNFKYLKKICIEQFIDFFFIKCLMLKYCKVWCYYVFIALNNVIFYSL